MRKKKQLSEISARALFLGLFLFLITPGLFALGSQEQMDSSEYYTITDMRGREVSIPAEVNSVIALGAGSLRLISYLDAANKVIAVEDSGPGSEISANPFFSLATYRLAYPEFRELPSIGSAENHEGIIAAGPDLIISSTIDSSQLDQLQSVLGIPVLAVNVDLELFNTESFYSQLKLPEEVLDREARAEELINGIEASLNDIESRTAEMKAPKRAYAGGMIFYGPADLLRTTGDYLPFDLTGTENVMPTNPSGNRQPYMTSLEDLVAAAPEYVFIDAANVHLSKSGFETNREVLEEQVPAFQNQQVYTTLVYKYYGTNWENQLINVYYVGKVLLPDLYSDITMKDKAEEIWKLFFNTPLEYQTVVEQQNSGTEKVDWFN